MKYLDGRPVQLGDKVSLGGGMLGEVVAIIDVSTYAEGYVESEWKYLEKGVLVHTLEAGLIHYPELEENFDLLARAS